MFPPIKSPCPLQSIQFPESGNFNCSACKREVHDLSSMTTDERETFLRSCSGKVCVSYKVKRSVDQLKRSAIAGLFLVSASGLALPAAAQVGDALAEDMDEIFVGGIDLQTHVEQAEDAKPSAEDKNLQLIPVVEEDESDDSAKSTQSKK